MPKYNKAQLTIIIINLSILVFGNLILFIYLQSNPNGLLPNLENNGTAPVQAQTRSLTKVDLTSGYKSEQVNIELGKQFELNDGFIYEVNGENFLVISSPSLFTIRPDGLIELTAGSMVFKPKNETNVSFGRDAVTLLSNSMSYIDSASASIFVYSGSARAQFQTASDSQKLFWNIDTFATQSFERSSVGELADFDKLLFAVDTIGLKVDTIFDLTPPSVYELIPSSSLVVATDTYQISGQTDARVELYINGNQVDVDSQGRFLYEVELVLGENKFNLVFYDEFLQQTQREISIFRDTTKVIIAEPSSFTI